MLGWSLFRACSDVTAFCNVNTRRRTLLASGIDRAIHLDDEGSVRELFACERPSLIVCCAGVCDVEKCEGSPDFAHKVNVDGTRYMLDHAPAGTRIVYCSSDHVFSGDTGPYREDSPTDPISVYGRTRVAAEQLVLARPNTLVIRTGPWIGPSASGRNGHLDWLRYRKARQLPMTVVADEQRSAVWAEDAARRVWELARSRVTGIRHVTATRVVSRPELARYLDARFEIGAAFELIHRNQRPAPHLGRVELSTLYRDELATPLPSVVDLR
jgi:dTDP-4-dehydrorhamnose reductase